jgi:hypothetical protein
LNGDPAHTPLSHWFDSVHGDPLGSRQNPFAHDAQSAVVQDEHTLFLHRCV